MAKKKSARNQNVEKTTSVTLAVATAIVIAAVLIIIGILAYRNSDITTTVDREDTQSSSQDEASMDIELNEDLEL